MYVPGQPFSDRNNTRAPRNNFGLSPVRISVNTDLFCTTLLCGNAHTGPAPTHRQFFPPKANPQIHLVSAYLKIPFFETDTKKKGPPPAVLQIKVLQKYPAIKLVQINRKQFEAVRGKAPMRLRRTNFVAVLI